MRERPGNSCPPSALHASAMLTSAFPSLCSCSSNQEIQTYAIALINALFLKAPEDKRQVCAHSLAKPLARVNSTCSTREPPLPWQGCPSPAQICWSLQDLHLQGSTGVECSSSQRRGGRGCPAED